MQKDFFAARMAAVDGFSIHGISKSVFIRQSLQALNYNLPKGQSNVMKLVHKFYEIAKCEMIEKIKCNKEKKCKT
jgi:hypothetical protein